jgi:hypothetical protein
MTAAFILAHWRAGLILSLALMFFATCELVKHERAENAVLQAKVAAAQLQADTYAKDAVVNQAAITKTATEAATRAAINASLRSTVHAAPPSSSCAASAPVRALLDGLRATGSGNPAPASSPGAVGMHR